MFLRPKIEHREGEQTMNAPVLAGTVKPQRKFSLLKNFGIITVPEGYDHASHLSTFASKCRIKFGHYDPNITDQNFPKPSYVMKPGDRLWVRAFNQTQIEPSTTSSAERMRFLKSENSILVGAQGASLVWDYLRHELPEGYWYDFFDENDRLWKDRSGYRRLPCLYHNKGGAFDFYLSRFVYEWGVSRAFVSVNVMSCDGRHKFELSP